jgi:hypothetical protein
MTINKIKVKETTSIDSYSFEGKLEEIIEMLQDWENEGEWEGIEIDYYEEGNNYQLYKHREETDKEYDKRMKLLEKEKAEKVKAKERHLKQLKKDLASLSDTDRKLLGL